MTIYKPIIGLEIHAELLTQSKAFCNCKVDFGGEPNSRVCPVCLGLPGSLPVINKKMIELGLKIALATNCKINYKSVFARKNYFYPDLPKGYQISQYSQPIGENGYLELNINGETRKVRITRVHLEEDTGKLVHIGSDRLAGSKYSLIDFNRAGVPLVEIVSEPDITSAKEARAYAEEIRNILIYLNACDGKMEEGSLRVEVNISLYNTIKDKLGTKVEIKNLNSFKSIEKAIEYEIIRQTELLNNNQNILQETRLWDENKHITTSMRTKEYSHDYRYFPEPDLPPLNICSEWINKLHISLPELPCSKRKRYINEFNLPLNEVELLISNKELANFFDECVSILNAPKIILNWILGDISAYLNETKLKIENTKLTPEHLCELIGLIQNETISNKIAKNVLLQTLKTGKSPKQIVQEQDLGQITDIKVILNVIYKVLEQNPNQINDYKKGNEKVLTYLIGQIMKETKGKAHPELTNKLLKDVLLTL